MRSLRIDKDLSIQLRQERCEWLPSHWPLANVVDSVKDWIDANETHPQKGIALDWLEAALKRLSIENNAARTAFENSLNEMDPSGSVLGFYRRLTSGGVPHERAMSLATARRDNLNFELEKRRGRRRGRNPFGDKLKELIETLERLEKKNA